MSLSACKEQHIEQHGMHYYDFEPVRSRENITSFYIFEYIQHPFMSVHAYCWNIVLFSPVSFLLKYHH